MKTEFSFLQGGGEMGGLMRSKDWSRAAVGDPNNWPQSLKTLIGTILHARFPMFLWWGTELTCFYNDAYRPSLGENGKHPAILGAPAEQAWPEIWPVIKPLIDKVLLGESVWMEDQLIPIERNGKMEDVYWTFSYSRVSDDHGNPAGVLVICQETTEAVNSLRELKEREDQLLFTIKAADLGTWDLNPFSNHFAGNAQLKEWFGLRPDDEIDLPEALRSIADKDRNRVVAAIQEALRPGSGGNYDIEYSIIHPKTQREINVLARGKALFNEDHLAYRFSGTIQDLTQLKLADSRLRENEERLSVVVDASELGIWELQLGTDDIVYSGRYHEIFGFGREQKVSHRKLLEMLYPGDKGIRDRAFEKAMEKGDLYYQSRIIWDNQTVHWIEIYGRVLYDENAKAVKLIGTVRDITEQKNSQRILEESEEKFRLLADSMAQFVWTADPSGNLNYYNKSVYDYSGLSREQIERGGWLQIVHPEDREKNIHAWMHSVHAGSPFYFEHRFRHHNGNYRWQLSRAIPQRDSAGLIQMWVGTSTDIEDQKIFSAELEKQVGERTRELEFKNNELRKMNAELESFAYVSSHDLQEPLRKIQILSSILTEKESASFTDSGKDYLNRIQNSAKRMQILIEDLLTYSRTNDKNVVYVQTDLAGIATEVIASYKDPIEEKQVLIDLGPFCTVKAIPYQMRQLLMNLVGNALKFTRENIQARIKIEALMVDPSPNTADMPGMRGPYCRITVADNGIGFDSKYKEKIFEVFQRLHGRDEYAGTGIGLSIVKKIVDNHRGIITASSIPGEGARFEILLPAFTA